MQLRLVVVVLAELVVLQEMLGAMEQIQK